MFNLIKEIKSKEGVLHFQRWNILSTPWFSIYFHKIYKADEDKHLHDHPWNYTSICLKGEFTEEREFQTNLKNLGILEEHIPYSVVETFRVVRRKAESFHKIKKLLTPEVWTLFFVGKRRREWGYDVDGKWIDNVTYRKMKNEGLLK